MAEQTRANFVILGATSDIGGHVLQSLTADGHQFFLAGRDEQRTSDVASNYDAPFTTFDATNADSVAAVFDQAKEQFGEVHGAVNLVGSIKLKPAHLTTPDEWREAMEINANSAFFTVKAATQAMKKTGGSIVLMSSAAARTGLPSHEAIAAAKGAVIGLTLAAAASYASKNIRVNCVAPGMVKTKLTERIWSVDSQLEASQAMHPLGRIGRPEDIAAAICWFLDPNNDFVTGQVLGIDGGLGSIAPRVTQKA
ncbi:SDR family NAD(P)-dependent oxidoreductase [Stratiformator vulcanicus]|uniref:2,5-dichloro-2,5-cyclohexadiene-1,4-diol dehydrogenase n=1 Tax=Stratiformator vulcanicus TaxID=2527980 RepID=A0A517R0Z0_9PLAN|nr:SDR family oxidoreductase [Stratiformator vulcanicus]QDT37565.1 2,5-dichloro-2,5-cyclohexadiene-1,4-diol dehydrogenase [Stratiformator vulcanicus]